MISFITVRNDVNDIIAANFTIYHKKKRRRKKIFIQMKYIWFYNVYILIVKSFIATKNISGTSFRKGEHVYKTKFTYTKICIIENSHTRLGLL